MSNVYDEIKSRPKAGLKFGLEKNQKRDWRVTIIFSTSWRSAHVVIAA